MIAVDTNILVRFLTRDDARQAARAKALIETASIFVPLTVVVETEWVLRTGYRFDRSAITAGMTRILGLPRVQVENDSTVAQALAWYQEGLDFADALHLASSRAAEAFATFDRSLRRTAGRLEDAPAVIAP